MELRDIVFEKLIDKMMSEELMTKTEFLERDAMNRKEFRERCDEMDKESTAKFEAGQKELKHFMIGTAISLVGVMLASVISIILAIHYH